MGVGKRRLCNYGEGEEGGRMVGKEVRCVCADESEGERSVWDG